MRPDPVPIRKMHGFALIDLIFVCGIIGLGFTILAIMLGMGMSLMQELQNH